MQPVTAASLLSLHADSAFVTSSPTPFEPFKEFQVPSGPCQDATISGPSSLDHQYGWSTSRRVETSITNCKPETDTTLWPLELEPRAQFWSHESVYVPSQQTSSPHSLNGGQRSIQCQVCGDESRGRHYGQYVCEACKSFFKRSVRKGPAYFCLRGGTCDIDARLRNRCRHCRWQRCLSVGLKKQYDLSPQQERCNTKAVRQRDTEERMTFTCVQNARLARSRPLASTSLLSSGPPSLNSVSQPTENPPWQQVLVSTTSFDDAQSYHCHPDNRPAPNSSLPPLLVDVGLPPPSFRASVSWLQEGPPVEALMGEGRMKMCTEEVKRLCHANETWTKWFLECVFVECRRELMPQLQSGCFELTTEDAGLIRLVHWEQPPASSESLAHQVDQMRCRWPKLVPLSITKCLRNSRVEEVDWSFADEKNGTGAKPREFLVEVNLNTPEGHKAVDFMPTGISPSFEDRRKCPFVPSTTVGYLIKRIVNAAAVLRPDDLEMALLKALSILTSVDFPLNEVQSLAYLRQSFQTTLVEHVFRRSACHLDAGQRILALKELVCYLAVVEPSSVLECLNLQELGSVS